MAKRNVQDSVGVGEAKSHLSELLDRVRTESVVITITRHGRPIARLVPLDLSAPDRHLAEARGWLDDDDPFFDDLAAIETRREDESPRVPALED